MGGLVWLNGQLRRRAEARISIDDFGFLYGAACFETMRAFGGVVFRLDRHLARLLGGLDALGVNAPAPEVLGDAVRATLGANALREARVRLTVSPGVGVGRLDVSSGLAPTVLVVAEPAPPDPMPARLVIASQRVDAARPLAHAKTANYLTSIIALAEARTAGGDDALLLGPNGEAVEAATANLFVVARGELVTPPLAAGPLPGITREAVLECAGAMGISCGERRIDRALLSAAEEVFVTNSIVGLRPVASVIGWWTGGEVPGAITSALTRAYTELVRQECGLD
jgi:branched-chain amino acid aminotransferase